MGFRAGAGNGGAIFSSTGASMNELIGKTVASLRVSADQSILTFDHPDGTSTSYLTDGDCCSETWFADITGVNALLGGKVVEVAEIDLPTVVDGRGRQDEDQFYGVKLRTEKGVADIVYRNSSNGYYGGSIGPFAGELPNDMKTITDDWSA
jgi:hypothetical protein